MPSSISSSESAVPLRAGFVRATASDRPGVAQPVPERDVPVQPWRRVTALAAVLVVLLTAALEGNARRLQLLPGDLGDGPSAWAEQRHRVDAGDVEVAIVGDSRILFDTDLDRFAAMTGARPLQLALPGTNARPFLENLAADANFHGLAIVGISEISYFRKQAGRFGSALKTFAFESPAQRISFLIQRALARHLGFLDDDYRLSKLVQRLDPDWRSGVDGPYHDVWKVWVNGDERRTWLWPRLETDARLRAHARAAWAGFAGPRVGDDIVAMTLESTRKSVAAIRARGGDVVFVRPPSAPQVRANEDQRLARSRGWDALLAAADVRGIHFDDLPAAQGLVLPEFSHLTRACAAVFTDAYVRRLSELTPRIVLRGDAPPLLTAADCGGSQSASSPASP